MRPPKAGDHVDVFCIWIGAGNGPKQSRLHFVIANWTAALGKQRADCPFLRRLNRRLSHRPSLPALQSALATLAWRAWARDIHGAIGMYAKPRGTMSHRRSHEISKRGHRPPAAGFFQEPDWKL